MDEPIASLRRRATSADVAKVVGTSQSAVSRAFTQGASVSPELRKRIVKAAASLGYTAQCDRAIPDDAKVAHDRRDRSLS